MRGATLFTKHPLALALIFVSSFAVPVILVFQYIKSSSSEFGQEEYSFSNPLELSRQSPGVLIEIPTADHKGRDLLIAGWFQFERWPKVDRKFTLLRFEIGGLEGGLAFVRDDDGIVPIITWPVGKRSKEFYLEHVTLIPRVWTAFLLSFQKGTLIGLHMGEVYPDGRSSWKLLGGYDIGSNMDFGVVGEKLLLDIGVFAKSTRGELGPVGVYFAKKRKYSLKDLIKGMIKNPGEIKGVSNEYVVFYTKDWKGDGFKLKKGSNTEQEKSQE